jgi:hypothetical protein
MSRKDRDCQETIDSRISAYVINNEKLTPEMK